MAAAPVIRKQEVVLYEVPCPLIVCMYAHAHLLPPFANDIRVLNQAFMLCTQLKRLSPFDVMFADAGRINATDDNIQLFVTEACHVFQMYDLQLHHVSVTNQEKSKKHKRAEVIDHILNLVTSRFLEAGVHIAIVMRNAGTQEQSTTNLLDRATRTRLVNAVPDGGLFDALTRDATVRRRMGRLRDALRVRETTRDIMELAAGQAFVKLYDLTKQWNAGFGDLDKQTYDLDDRDLENLDTMDLENAVENADDDDDDQARDFVDASDADNLYLPVDVVLYILEVLHITSTKAAADSELRHDIDAFQKALEAAVDHNSGVEDMKRIATKYRDDRWMMQILSVLKL